MIKQEQIDILKEDAYKLYEFSNEDKDNEEIVKMAMYYKKSSLVYASLRVQHLDTIKAYERLLRSTQYCEADPKIPSNDFLEADYDQGFISLEQYSENKTRLKEKEFRRIRSI